MAIPLGASVPALTPHAISVSLPTWQDNIGYEEGDKRVVDRMETGYPRFFIHRSIQKLAALCLAKFGRPDELCLLLPSPRVANQARDFLAAQTPSAPARIVEFVVCPSTVLGGGADGPGAEAAPAQVQVIELQILLFGKDDWKYAKAFWQHTGDYISSRCAERALGFLGVGAGASEVEGAATPAVPDKATSGKNMAYYSKNRHYSRRATGNGNGNGNGTSTPTTSQPPTPTFLPTPRNPNPPTTTETITEDALTADLTTYLEERYGRNLPLFNAPLAKQALRRRIAGGLLPSDEDYGKIADVARGVAGRTVTEDDVYLFPCGMSAIWHAHDIVRIARRREGEEGKSVCFGFPYTDTLKILQKWGAGCHFLGNGGTTDIPALEKLLSENTDAPILSLFCEFPSNPLLSSPDLVRIRQLADQYGFAVVVDETIGNFINVEVAQFADVVVSSLSKVFSGDANVMGGSLVLNPNSKWYEPLRSVLEQEYEDNYYPEDAVYMERNSRDYRPRIKRINDSAYDLCEWLRSISAETAPSDPGSGSAPRAVKRVYYPRYSTPEVYDQARRSPTHGRGGYGGLFSLTFASPAASAAFFDALECAKGPSLGTSFTLACPYVILAHYLELDWVQQFGVEPDLVRVSLGEEDGAVLRGWFERAVEAAQKAMSA